jgi:hypothetical protein
MAFLDLDLNLDGFLKHNKNLVVYHVDSSEEDKGKTLFPMALISTDAPS